MFHVFLSLFLCLITLISAYVISRLLKRCKSVCMDRMEARLDEMIKLAGESNEQEDRS